MTTVKPEDLKKAYKKEKDLRVARRMLAVNMVCMNSESVQVVADFLMQSKLDPYMGRPLQGGGMMLEPLYSDIHSKIVTEKILGLDETTFPIDGRTGCVGLQEVKQRHNTHSSIERCQDSKKVLEKVLRDSGFRWIRSIPNRIL